MQTSIIPRRALRASEKPSDFSPGGHHLRGRQTLVLLLASYAGIAAYCLESKHDASFAGQHAPGCFGLAHDQEVLAFVQAKDKAKGEKTGSGSPAPVWSKDKYQLFADGSVLVVHKAEKGFVDAEVYDGANQFVEVRLGGVVGYDSVESELLSVYQSITPTLGHLEAVEA